jgi:anti-anti-sigma factor
VVPPLCRTPVVTDARDVAVVEDRYPARWTGKRAVVTLPEHVGASNSGPIREQLAGLIDRGAAVLIADMTATISCDQRGADALLYACQRASGNGTQLRVAAAGPGVRRALEAAGLDRLVSIHPSVEAAVGAAAPEGVIPLAPGPARRQNDDQVGSGHLRGSGLPGRETVSWLQGSPRRWCGGWSTAWPTGWCWLMTRAC